jgi:hypothetical protein
VVNAWFLKRATDTEQDQAMYYFRLLEPDFTPVPVYEALKEYTRSSEARVLSSGVHQEDHWALGYDGPWELRTATSAELGGYRHADDPRSTLNFAAEGADLWLRMGPEADGAFTYSLDGGAEQVISFTAGEEILLAEALSRGKHTVAIRAAPGPLIVDSLTVRGRAAWGPWLLAGGAILLLGLVVAVVVVAFAGQRRWYERSRARR